LPIINRGLEFLELIRSECRRFDLYCKVELRARIFDEGDEFDLAFIDGFDQMFEVCSFAKVKDFDEENEKRREIANNPSFVFITNPLANSLE